MSGITEYAVADIYDYIDKVIFCNMFVVFLCVVSEFDFAPWLIMFDEILFYMQHEEREFVLKFSALEIYNESVRDLLSVDTTPLRLLDDPEVNIILNILQTATHKLFVLIC